MAPVVAILVLRKYDQGIHGQFDRQWKLIFVSLAASAILALSVAWADFSLANCQRAAAKTFQSLTSDRSGTLWFQGHWGFQYYMDLVGGKPVNVKGTPIKRGDLMLVPQNNTNVGKVNSNLFRHIYRLQVDSSPLIATISVKLGAGFYSSLWGPFPFAFGRVPLERYDLYTTKSFPRQPTPH